MSRDIFSILPKHLGFWILSMFILFRLFTKDYESGVADLIYTVLFHCPLLLLVYLNQWLFKHYFISKKFALYAFGMVVVIGLSLGLHFLIFEYWSNWLFRGYYFISYYSWTAILQFLISYWILSTLLFFTQNWFDLRAKQTLLSEENQRVKLDALKSQLNPHFLFNSLNNIYSLIDASQEKERNYIMKLSNALRYMLYETDDDLVLLEKEVEYLQNYVELERLRMNDPSEILFNFPTDFEGYLIAPLILLPCIENCFKHHRQDGPEIVITLSLNEGILKLSTRNYARSESEAGGIGLKNLQHRLALIYPEKYQLSTKNENQIFELQLSLDLNME